MSESILPKSPTKGREDEDDVMSVNSSTSTIEYEHEPFDTFQHKVLQLCEAQFGLQNITVERMTGGSFNRIIGVTVAPTQPKKWTSHWLRSVFPYCLSGRVKKKDSKHILRIPRSDVDLGACGMEYDVAVLRFVRSRVKFAVPDITSFDFTSTNVLGSPYMMQSRLPGQNLQQLWKGLSHPQRVSTLRSIVDITSQLHSLTSSFAGTIRPSKTLEDLHSLEVIEVEKFRITCPVLSTERLPATPPNAPQTTFEFLMETWERHAGFEKGVDTFLMPVWYKLRRIIIALHELGFLPDTDKFHFCHSDLYARNILAETPDDATVKINGVIDWDAQLSYFGPKFVAYRAPFWLWHSDQPSSDAEREESLAATEPGTEQDRQMKKLFEELAGEEWVCYAFTPEYVIARRLLYFVQLTMRSTQDFEEAHNIVRDWRELHYEFELQDNFHFTDIDQGSLWSVDSNREDKDEDAGAQSDKEDDNQHVEALNKASSSSSSSSRSLSSSSHSL
ncbi:hypothetical protein K458DRAFT_456465 [Lentithecium fluviatile CBS 122367]|uniref:Aminoglycoside phosphotransferase domain-containing protein n=1 Tax=Lentithecium fluviatile CBS 122367 TaxID=1168545 RepID=A0A6G1IVN1_9PLEO|nr:hypothetical protein K458DRAFT_456465 [Lentithecium fluviatile CBS 122367]